MGSNLSQLAKDRIYSAKKEGGTELNLSGCELKGVPIKILKFKKLKKLNMARNLIQAIPPEIRKIAMIHELDASSNELRDIAPEISSLEDLQVLDISNNQLVLIPPLPKNLTVLKLSINQLPNLNNELSLPKLEELHYARNKITIFPGQVISLVHLRVLNLSGNMLNYLPDEIEQLTALEHLDISENQFTEMPPTLHQLHNLRVLDLGKNGMGNPKENICQLTKLEVLHLNNCKISDMPFDISRLSNLTDLNFSGNQITEFNRFFCVSLEGLQKLKIFDASTNALTSIPRQLGYIKSLRKLLLAQNYIKTVPGEIHFLNPAIEISLVNNPLDYPFSDWHSHGAHVLIEKVRPFVRAYPPSCKLLDDPSTAKVGKPAALRLEAGDYSGGRRQTVGDTFEGSLDRNDPDGAELHIDVFIKGVKETPGLYNVFFNPLREGIYLLTIVSDGYHIKGSPFEVHVQPAD